jgi:molecular chaperone HtpG
VSINGDEIRKGYETPLTIDDSRTIDILDIVCRKIESDRKIIGWYWFCISKFEGVLPKKCWQRNIRLRKANIQIGEADCLSNHPKRGQALWKEDRGNTYFLGEIHALDNDLIPNSRRDYFNQDMACRIFETTLQSEFSNLYRLYHDASTVRSAYTLMRTASTVQKEFETKERKGEFFDSQERSKAQEKVMTALEKAKEAKKTIEKIEDRLNSAEKDAEPLAQVVDVYKNETKEDNIHVFDPSAHPKKGYAKDGIKKNVKDVLDIVFEVLNKMLPEDEAAPIREAIIKKVIGK